jgi:predicted regulator of Ras-like GTPase activity (Roadblock/LC7/MglB family)
MPLRVSQIIYTSLPSVGFKSLASQQVPPEIEQAFRQQVVHQYWDAYNPPGIGYRAAYLYQVSPQQTLFGWLYNDGTDDLGRSHTPYFLSYYTGERLSENWLPKILTCLEVGPLALIERQHLPTALEMLAIPDSCRYQPARPGVKIPSHLQQQSQQHWEAEKLLQLFVPLNLASDIFEPLPPAPPIFLPSQATRQPSQEKTVSEILAALKAKPIGIQAVALISQAGKPLLPPLGIEESRAEIMAGLLLYLAQNVQNELKWSAVDHITVRAQESHLILTCCDAETFLLVAAEKSLAGLLEGEINRTVKQLQPLVG